jgi:hypothetical protein
MPYLLCHLIYAKLCQRLCTSGSNRIMRSILRFYSVKMDQVRSSSGITCCRWKNLLEAKGVYQLLKIKQSLH